VFKYYEYADIEDQDDFFEYVSGIKALAPFDTGVNPSWPDQLVTLSTCAYHTDNGRFAMVGRKVE
jgi:sortase B